jgi:hypothetical protein
MRQKFLIANVNQSIGFKYHGDGSSTIQVRMTSKTGKSRFANCTDLPVLTLKNQK